jgi:hypothetical protein
MSCSHEIDNKNTIVTVPQNVDKERRISTEKEAEICRENVHRERKKKEREKEKCFKIKVSHRINLDDLSRD